MLLCQAVECNSNSKQGAAGARSFGKQGSICSKASSNLYWDQLLTLSQPWQQQRARWLRLRKLLSP
jgi:hypothetical protein